MDKFALLLIALLGVSAHAATFRWTDANGQVVYGDRPPANGAWLVQDTDGDGGITPPSPAGALPYAVRSAATRFPVRLYTVGDCAPCDAARAHLTQRGVPFSERVLRTEGDLTAFRQLGFTDKRTPAMSVGREKTQGYDADEWTLLLDAAGYPKSSMLPRGWRPPSAQPLTPTNTPGGAAANRSQAGVDPTQGSGAPGPTAATGASDPNAGAGAGAVSAKPAASPEPVPERAYAKPVSTRRDPLQDKQPPSSAASGAIRF